MKKLLLWLTVVLFAAGCTSVVEDETNFRKDGVDSAEYVYRHDFSKIDSFGVPLIPFPKEAVRLGGGYDFSVASYVVYSDLEGFNTTYFEEFSGLTPAKASGLKILIKGDSSLGSEAYTLKVSAEGVEITAADSAGVFNAETTLIQLIIFFRKQNSKNSIPLCEISDAPAFKFRGVMHDTGRNYQSIGALKEQMKKLALYKINVFHFHLTDNPAWRLENRKYPELNNPANRIRSRTPEKSYTYDEYLDFVEYCKSINITVVPEFDMPGHSKYFFPTFGFTMQSSMGMRVLENSLKEFCSIVPAELAPYIHIGSDEVHIINKRSFIRRMTGVVKKCGRSPIVWNPGLMPENDTILQFWGGGSINKNYVNLDSSNTYTNNSEPLNVVRKVFFKQICGTPDGSVDFAFGGICCTWNDVAVAEESDVLTNNPFYTAALTFSETNWCGTPVDRKQYYFVAPPAGSLEMKAFAEFESRLLAHKDVLFASAGDEFFYTEQSDAEWKIVTGADALKVEPAGILESVDSSRIIRAGGTSVYLSLRFGKGLLQDFAPGEKIAAVLEFESDRDGELDLLWNSDFFARSNRQYGGIPQQGDFDNYGTEYFCNGEPLKPAEWKQPGAFEHSRSAAWHRPVQEVPWTDEEIYWKRAPIRIQVKKGLNRIVVKTTKGYTAQLWMLTAVPVEFRNGTAYTPDWITFVK